MPDIFDDIHQGNSYQATPAKTGGGKDIFDDIHQDQGSSGTIAPKKGFLQAFNESLPLSTEQLPPSPDKFMSLGDSVKAGLSDIGKSLWPGKGTRKDSPVLNTINAIPMVGPGLANLGEEFTENPTAAAGRVVAGMVSGVPGPVGTTPVWRSPIRQGDSLVPNASIIRRYVPGGGEALNVAQDVSKIRLQNPVKIVPSRTPRTGMTGTSDPAWMSINPTTPGQPPVESIPSDLPSGRVPGKLTAKTTPNSPLPQKPKGVKDMIEEAVDKKKTTSAKPGRSEAPTYMNYSDVDKWAKNNGVSFDDATKMLKSQGVQIFSNYRLAP